MNLSITILVHAHEVSYFSPWSLISGRNMAYGFKFLTMLLCFHLCLFVYLYVNCLFIIGALSRQKLFRFISLYSYFVKIFTLSFVKKKVSKHPSIFLTYFCSIMSYYWCQIVENKNFVNTLILKFTKIWLQMTRRKCYLSYITNYIVAYTRCHKNVYCK